MHGSQPHLIEGDTQEQPLTSVHDSVSSNSLLFWLPYTLRGVRIWLKTQTKTIILIGLFRRDKYFSLNILVLYSLLGLRILSIVSLKSTEF